MLNIGDIAVTSLDVITAFGMDGSYRFTMDELQNATIANTQETQDITGRGGRLLNTLKRNKAVTVSGTNGLISGGMLEAQTGGAFANKESTPVHWTESLVISSNKAATSYVAVGTAGAEIEALWLKNASGAATTQLTQAATAAAGKFAYDPETKELSFASGAYENGQEIVVYYSRNVAGSVLANEADKYSEKLRLIIDATGEDKCSNVYRLQFEVPRADFSGNFDVALGDNQAVHAFEARSLVSAGCGAANSGYLWTYTIFGANAEDVEAEEETNP